MNERGRKKEKWFLYVVKCLDGSLYTGITKNVARRLQQHNDGRASRYTRSRRPVKLMYQEGCRNKSSALKKECAIKALTRKGKELYLMKKMNAEASRRARQ